MKTIRQLSRLCKDRDLHLILLATFLFGLAAHGYCYFNMFYSHDSILVYQNDVAWQISLGRFLHPVWFMLRGNFYTPSLVGMLALFFIAMTAWLTVQLLDIRRRGTMVLISAIMTVNGTVTLLNATYIHDIDIYMFCLMCVVWGVYAMKRLRYGNVWAVAAFVISLALYQSFFQVGVFLLMVLSVKDILDGKDTKEVVTTGLRSIAALFAGLIVYFALMKLMLLITGIPMETGYNGISQVGKYTGIASILKPLLKTYFNTAYYFLRPDTFHDRIIEAVNIVILASAGFFLFRLVKIRKICRTNVIILLAILVLMPFGINLVCFISQGIEHRLMGYSIFYIFIFAIYLEQLYLEHKGIADLKVEEADGKQAAMKLAYPCLLAVMIFCCCVYSNQTYLYKQLVYQNTLTITNRVIDRIEQTDGYEVGVTPVVIVGAYDEGHMKGTYEGFNHITTGMESTYSVTVPWTYETYFRQVLNYNINLMPSESWGPWLEQPDVVQMHPFPAKDSCKIIGGTMVIKLS